MLIRIKIKYIGQGKTHIPKGNSTNEGIRSGQTKNFLYSNENFFNALEILESFLLKHRIQIELNVEETEDLKSTISFIKTNSLKIYNSIIENTPNIQKHLASTIENKVEEPIPDLEWTSKLSLEKNIPTKCPFATVKNCPRFYQSLSLLGEAGSTKIEKKEDKKLLKFWKKSDLWPITREYATSISGSSNMPSNYSNFCPEVSYARFGYYAINYSKYVDEIDIELAHKQLRLEDASPNDPLWNWAYLEKLHYSDCTLFSIIGHREKKSDTKKWYEKIWGKVVIGITITVIAGLILHFILKVF